MKILFDIHFRPYIDTESIYHASLIPMKPKKTIKNTSYDDKECSNIIERLCVGSCGYTDENKLG